MAVSRSRRGLLMGWSGGKAKAAPFRPPWGLSEPAFVDTCTRCGDCAKACPEGIVFAGDGGFPEIDFKAGHCTFCGDCAAVCAVKAIDREGRDRPWPLIARIEKTICLSEKGVTCRVCGDRCEVGAIRFELAVGGVAFVDIDQGRCTGCGACFEPCPADAVKIVLDPMVS